MKRSFKKSIRNAGLPVIKLSLYGKYYNFLVDTGSSSNHISVEAYADFEDKVSQTGISNTYGIDAKILQMKIIEAEYSFDKKKVKSFFSIDDTSECLNIIAKETGCKISGILGTDFLLNGRFLLDYGKMCLISQNNK